MEAQGPWFRLYHEWASDPDVQVLSEADQRRHIMLMALRCRGCDPSIPKFAKAMGITDLELIQSIARMREAGLHVDESGGLPTWTARQGRPEHARKKDQRTRVPALSRRCPGTVPPLSHTVDLESDPDASSSLVLIEAINPNEEDARARVGALAAPPPAALDEVDSLDPTEPPAAEPPPGNAPDDTCPHQAIIALYHRVLPALAHVEAWTERGVGRRNLRARWREDPERQTLAWWLTYFQRVARSPFLMGEVESGDRQPFACDLTWLVRPTNLEKVLNGRYDPKDAPPAKKDPRDVRLSDLPPERRRFRLALTRLDPYDEKCQMLRIYEDGMKEPMQAGDKDHPDLIPND